MRKNPNNAPANSDRISQSGDDSRGSTASQGGARDTEEVSNSSSPSPDGGPNASSKQQVGTKLKDGTPDHVETHAGTQGLKDSGGQSKPKMQGVGSDKSSELVDKLKEGLKTGGNSQDSNRTPPSPVRVADHNVVAGPSNYMIDHQTLRVGGAPVTLSSHNSNPSSSAILGASPAHRSGSPLAAMINDDHSLILASQIIPISLAAPSQTSLTPENHGATPSDAHLPTMTIAGSTITPVPASLGGCISLSGVPLSPGGPASTLAPLAAEEGAAEVGKADTRPISLDRLGNLIIGSPQTHSLPPFQALTSAVAQGVEGDEDDIRSEHGQLAPATSQATTSAGIGEMIMEGFGGPALSSDSVDITEIAPGSTTRASGLSASDGATNISGGRNSPSSTASPSGNVGDMANSTSSTT